MDSELTDIAAVKALDQGVTTTDSPTFVEVTAAQYNSTEALPDIKPSLNLDFANTKALDPRITYTRGSTATYYDGKTFAKAEENLVPDSSFATDWASTLVTVTTGQSAPDGSTDAVLVTDSGDGRFFILDIIGGSNVGAGYQRSIYAKVASGTADTYILAHNTATGALVTLTDSWQRFDLEATDGGFLETFYGVDFRGASNTATAVYLWAPQLEKRDAVTDYTPTSGQPITNYVPALHTAVSGEPRFDHDPITGESKGFLIEEQRTNLLTYSEQFDNAAWTKVGSSITANTVVAPDGTLTGDKLVEDTGSGTHRFRSDVITTSADTNYSFTVYAKENAASAKRFLILYLSGTTDITTGSRRSVVFDLSNGTSDASGGSTFTLVDYGAVNVGNGWYRCQITVTTDAAGTTIYAHTLATDSFSSTSTTYTGDGYSGIYLWGAQLEAGSFPTSYIPTVASQVTRSPDAASMTGTNFSSWYRQDEGTVFVEGGDTSRASILYTLDAGSLFTNGIFGEIDSTGEPGAVVWSGGTKVSDIDHPAMFNPPSLAAAFKTNDFAICVDGQTVVTDTTGAMPSPANTLRIGQRGSVGHVNGHIKKLAYYPKRLSNATLQALTEE